MTSAETGIVPASIVGSGSCAGAMPASGCAVGCDIGVTAPPGLGEPDSGSPTHATVIIDHATAAAVTVRVFNIGRKSVLAIFVPPVTSPSARVFRGSAHL